MQVSGTTLQLVYEIGHRPTGRRRLAAATGSSEMAVRLELERLRMRGTIELRRTGPRMTEVGRAEFEPLFEFVRDVRPIGLSALQIDVAGLGARVAPTVSEPAWLLRDIAVRRGASGLLLLRRDLEQWVFAHNAEPVALRNYEDAKRMDETLIGAQSDDHLVVAFGSDLGSAARGLWAVLAVSLKERLSPP